MKIFNKFNYKYIIIGIITGVTNGLFGSGGGTIVVPAMIILLNIEDQKAHATAISIILPLTLTSSFLYISNGLVDWNVSLKVILGGIFGGYFGAKLLHRCPSTVLRKIFGIFMLIAAIRMLK